MIRQRLGKQSEGQKYALFMIDIDDFKAINDSYGHMEGDAVIAQTALQLKKLFSPADITGRFGGDEFIVFFDEISDRKEIEEKAEKRNAPFRGHECFFQCRDCCLRGQKHDI